MRNYLFIGYFFANIIWYATCLVRAWISKYFNYELCIMYTNTFGITEWVLDLVSFSGMMIISVFFFIISLKSNIK